jgi:tetratricopeptide (TPR) repeat protein
MLEGGMFLAGGLAPGVEAYFLDAARQLPAEMAVSPESLEALVAAVKMLQRVALVFGTLCLAGGFGAAQRKPWGKWAAVAASAGNVLVLFPLGIAGLFVFLRSDEKSGEAEKKQAAGGTAAEPVSHLLVLIASLALVVNLRDALQKFAASQGLPVNDGGGVGLEWILGAQLVFTLFHELGHLLAAWGVGFRFHEINVGPFTLTERPGGSWAFRFSWNRILASGGYLQAVPVTTKDLRMNWILVVIAGPAASLFLAMIGFLVLVSLPGTEWAGQWEWAAFVAAICAADCVANLLPLGLTDGALLVHTLVGSRRGKAILAGLEAAMLNDRADREGGLMDPAELLETRRKALEQLQKSEEVPGVAIAAQRMEFAQASMRNGRVRAAADALREAGKTLEGIADVPPLLWFRYWSDLFETATAMGQHSMAARAREKGLEYADQLAAEGLDWETMVPVQVTRARLLISDGEYETALQSIGALRAECPARRSMTASAAELLTVESECALRLGRREEAAGLAEAAIAVAEGLPDGQRAAGMELLAHAAVRFSRDGEWEFAQPLFAAGVAGLEAAGAAAVSTAYRTAWAEALYENGKLRESKDVLTPVVSAGLAFAMDIETLRAQLLLAEDRPADAVAALDPVLADPGEEAEEEVRMEYARGLALRSWARYRSGSTAEGMEDARLACDRLMPSEHPDAAPALLTLAMSVAGENDGLAEAYLQESSRLICDTTLLSPLTKASRLRDLARSMLQANRKDWGKRMMEDAARYGNTRKRVAVPA